MILINHVRRTGWALTAMLAVAGSIVAFAASATQPGAEASTVVVTFNIRDVMENLAQRADAEAQLQGIATDIQDALQERIDRIGELEARVDASAEDEREEVTNLLEQRKLEAITYRSFAQERLDIEKSLMLNGLYESIKKSVAEIADANGYDIVLVNDSQKQIGVIAGSQMSREAQILEQVGAQRVFFARPRIDITDQIVTRMNLDWSARTTG